LEESLPSCCGVDDEHVARSDLRPPVRGKERVRATRARRAP
jgi:hypothetical protein